MAGTSTLLRSTGLPRESSLEAWLTMGTGDHTGGQSADLRGRATVTEFDPLVPSGPGGIDDLVAPDGPGDLGMSMPQIFHHRRFARLMIIYWTATINPYCTPFQTRLNF